MPMPAIRIVISRANFRDLVAGRELEYQISDPVPIKLLVDLDLDRAGALQKWSDPPEAREFLKKPGKGQQR